MSFGSANSGKENKDQVSDIRKSTIQKIDDFDSYYDRLSEIPVSLY